MDPSVLTVYRSPFPKVRLGRDGDGGYVIADLPVRYNTLLSGGVDDDISFEDEFMKRYSCTNCYAFDNSISELPTHSQPIRFTQKKIGGVNDDTVTNLHDIIDVTDRIFVKMDIEGGEYAWIRSLRDDQMNKFEQIVMEFHAPFFYNTAIGMEIFTKLNRTHRLVHLHPNNVTGCAMRSGVAIPNIFEGTYLHKKYFQRVLLNTDTIPGPLDRKNVLAYPDIEIGYPPFVHNWSNPIFGIRQRIRNS